MTVQLIYAVKLRLIVMSKNLEKCYNTSENTDTEQFLLSVLVFIDSLVAQVAFGLPYLLIDLFYIGMPVVRTDGRLLVRAVYGHVISKFSRMGRFT